MAKSRMIRESNVTERNRVLLMAEMELRKFDHLRPDEASCIKDVYRRFTGNFEPVCRNCGGDKTEDIDERSFLCLTCHKRCWYTADTPFFKFKKIKPWLFAQWLHKKGIMVNGSQLAGLTKVSKSTGNCIMRKVETLSSGITEESKDERLLAAPGSDVIFQLREQKRLHADLKIERRKVIQTIKQVPWPEPQALPQPQQRIDLVQSSAATTPLEVPQENSLEASSLLAVLTDKPQNFDTLINRLGCKVSWLSATLVRLELDGLVTRLPGDCYVKANKTAEMPRMKRNYVRQKKSSVSQKTLRVQIVVSIIDSIKLAWSDISKIIVNQFRQLSGAA